MPDPKPINDTNKPTNPQAEDAEAIAQSIEDDIDMEIEYLNGG